MVEGSVVTTLDSVGASDAGNGTKFGEGDGECDSGEGDGDNDDSGETDIEKKFVGDGAESLCLCFLGEGGSSF